MSTDWWISAFPVLSSFAHTMTKTPSAGQQLQADMDAALARAARDLGQPSALTASMSRLLRDLSRVAAARHTRGMSFRVRYSPNAPTTIAAKDVLTDDDTYDFLPGGVLKIHTADNGWTFYLSPDMWNVVDTANGHEPGGPRRTVSAK